MSTASKRAHSHSFRLPFCFALLGTLVANVSAVPPAAASAQSGAVGPAATSTATVCTDILTFGDEASERLHSVAAERSEVIKGALGDPARTLLPLATPTWEGGRLRFVLKVDPDKPNYVTVRLWGDDVNENQLALFCEGKQIGYRHLGDVDLLDHGAEQPEWNGRFVYKTSPLPLSLTQGKTQVACEIRGSGRTWGYANTFDGYQKVMTSASRGIYRCYSHVEGCFVPTAGEKQGSAPSNPPVRSEPGREVLAQAAERVNGSLAGILRDGRPPGQMPMQFLARAYWEKGTVAFENPKVVEQVVRGCDELFRRYRKDPKLAESEPSTPNPEWFGLGPAGDAIRLLARPLAPMLDAGIEDGAGGKIPRRTAWSEMLVASRDWHRFHRRQYTNQSMITDLNIYRANRGVAAVDPGKAMPEKEVLRYLYESVALQPWLGSDTESGPAKPLGENFYQLTAKGLTRELGFVGYYGEVLDWMVQLYEATQEPGQAGDPKLKAQIEKAAAARAIFRYPALDAHGFRAMRAETVVGWRDTHFPGDVTYGQRATRDSSPIAAAAVTLSPGLLGSAQQMFADNQFFATVAETLESRDFRTTIGLLGVPGQYELVSSRPPDAHRLPMSPEEPDFAWADEEDGVVAIKRGGEIVYASLYWRARNAVNFLARVHRITPQFTQTATVREEIEFEPSGMTYTRPDWVNWAFGNGGPRYPAEMHSAHAGEKLPIAKIPPGIPFKAGQESLFAGKGSFYTLRYGPYLIGMNTTTDREFELKAPANVSSAPDLVTGKTVSLGAPLKVRPRSTVVLFVGE